MATAFPAGDPGLPANIHPIRFCGMIYWDCRHCGAPNRRRIRYTTWKVQCSNRLCKRWMMFSVIEEDVARGSHPQLLSGEIGCR